MFHISLSATVKDAEQHNRVYTELGTVQDQLAGEIPSVSLSSFDMTCTGDDGEEYFDDQTMFKVYDTIMGSLPMNSAHARDIISALQNAGILFRERRGVVLETIETDDDRARSAIGDA